VDDSFTVLNAEKSTITYTVLPGTSACLDVIPAVPASWGTFNADVYTSYTANPVFLTITGAKYALFHFTHCHFYLKDTLSFVGSVTDYPTGSFTTALQIGCEFLVFHQVTDY